MAVTPLDAETALAVIDLQHGIAARPTVHSARAAVKRASAMALRHHTDISEAGRNRDVPGDHRPARQGPRMNVAAAQIAHG
jgi:hypothetical protein